jgi:hypothetical protein
MAKYKSKYAELTFYVEGEAHSFKDGNLHTEDKEVIAVLDKLEDVKQIEEPKPKVAPTKKASAKK